MSFGAATSLIMLLGSTSSVTSPARPLTPPEVSASEATAGEPASEPDDVQMEDIVVTATRSEQPLSRVPASISAFDQQAIDRRGVKSLADLALFAPGIRFDNGSNQIAIRGIASDAGAATTGIYLDETPIQIRNLGFASDEALPALFDIERVEVLRGPQGTLFGAGSQGGTIRYIPVAPELDRYSVYGRGELSFTRHGGTGFEAGAALGGPLVADTLGVRVSGYRREASGWVDKSDFAGNVVDPDGNDDVVTALRGALAWQAAPDVRVTPTIYYQRRVTADDRFVEGQSRPGRGVFRDSSPERRRNKDRFMLPSLKVEAELGTVSVIANASHFRRSNLSGYDGTIYNLSYYQTLPLDPACVDDCATAPTLLLAEGVRPDVGYYLSPSRVANRQRIWTGELRAQSDLPTRRLNWVAGLFMQHQRQLSSERILDPLGDRLFQQLFGTSLADYFGQAAGLDEPIPLAGGTDSYVNRSVVHERQVAAFGEVTWRPIDRLGLTGGLRYADISYRFSNFADGPQNFGRSEGRGRTRNRPLTPKASMSYRIADDQLLYATYAKGFRPGGANAPVPYDVCSADFDALGIAGNPTSYDADTVDSFELGSKNRLLGRNLSVDASVFRINWKGIQQFVTLPSCAISYIDNLGRARAEGFDVQLSARPLAGLLVDLAVSYTRSRYTRDAGYGTPTSLVARKGDELDGSPWSASASAQQNLAVGRNDFYLRGDVRYIGGGARTKEQNPVTAAYDLGIVPAEAGTNVGLRVGGVIGPADVSIFADNLLDSAPLFDRQHSGTDTLLFTNRTWRPRTIGLTAVVRR
jgi:outer membrane receptor protein involved in Fe transport